MDSTVTCLLSLLVTSLFSESIKIDSLQFGFIKKFFVYDEINKEEILCQDTQVQVTNKLDVLGFLY